MRPGMHLTAPIDALPAAQLHVLHNHLTQEELP